MNCFIREMVQYGINLILAAMLCCGPVCPEMFEKSYISFEIIDGEFRSNGTTEQISYINWTEYQMSYITVEIIDGVRVFRTNGFTWTENQISYIRVEIIDGVRFYQSNGKTWTTN